MGNHQAPGQSFADQRSHTWTCYYTTTQKSQGFSFLMMSCHMRSRCEYDGCTYRAPSIALNTFITQAKGIHLYDMDCRRVLVGMEVLLRRNPSHYDLNAVDLLVSLPQQNLFLGHLAREPARFVSPLLLNGLKITA